MKFYEVAPNLAMTRHAITIRPLCFSKATFDRPARACPRADPQAGKEAGAYAAIDRVVGGCRQARRRWQTGPLERIPFRGRDEMKARVDPVMAEYAADIGVAEIYEQINAIQ